MNGIESAAHEKQYTNMPLRDYQQDAVNSVIDYFDQQKGNAPLVVMPTGSGKSLVLAKLALDWNSVFKDYGRVYIITHRAELLRQSYKLLAGDPEVRIARYAAALGYKQLGGHIIMGMVQSLCRVTEQLPPATLVIVDEAHLVPPRTTRGVGGQYRRVLDKLVGEQTKLVGLTATPFRLGQGYLWDGDPGEPVFDGVAYDADLLSLVGQGYLVPPKTYRGKTAHSDDNSDLAQVRRTSDGEFQLGEQDKVLLRTAAPDICRELATRFADQKLKRWLVFTPGVEGSKTITRLLQDNGIAARCVVGSTPEHEREAIYSQFRDPEGTVECIVGCDVLTTGFDAPITNMIVLVRATESPSLYVQIIGRGMRPFDGKDSCTILDFGGNVARHGAVNAVRVAPKEERQKKDNKKPKRAKTCPNCFHLDIDLEATSCSECGYEYPLTKRYIKTAASTQDLLVSGTDALQRSADPKTVKARVIDCGWEIFNTFTTDQYFLRFWAKLESSPALDALVGDTKIKKFTALEHVNGERWLRRLSLLRGREALSGEENYDLFDLAAESEHWIRPQSVVVGKRKGRNGKEYINIIRMTDWGDHSG